MHSLYLFTYSVKSKYFWEQYCDGDGHLVTHSHGATKPDGRNLRYVNRNNYCVDTYVIEWCMCVWDRVRVWARLVCEHYKYSLIPMCFNATLGYHYEATLIYRLTWVDANDKSSKNEHGWMDSKWLQTHSYQYHNIVQQHRVLSGSGEWGNISRSLLNY